MILLSDITATSTTNMNIENKEVTLRSEGENIYTVLKDDAFTTMILDIRNSNTVTTTNVTFDGNNVISTGALIESYNSTLNLNEGTAVQNNNNRGRYYEEPKNTGALGGGLSLWESTCNINGANIIYNKTSAQSGVWSHGGGIYIKYGTLTLNSGTISYNENSGTITNAVGGGISLSNSNFYMNGGEIKSNKTHRAGGGIWIASATKESQMIMTAGRITNNTVIGDSVAWFGGGICASVEGANTIVYLKGGIVENNISPTGPNTYAANGSQIIDQR